MAPSWGQTLSLFEEKKHVRLLKTDGDKFKAILDAAGYSYDTDETSFGEFLRFTLKPKQA